jgi:hypothetical protein
MQLTERYRTLSGMVMQLTIKFDFRSKGSKVSSFLMTREQFFADIEFLKGKKTSNELIDEFKRLPLIK